MKPPAAPEPGGAEQVAILLSQRFAGVTGEMWTGAGMKDAILVAITAAEDAARREALLAAAEWHEALDVSNMGRNILLPQDRVAAYVHRESAAHFRQLAEGNPSTKESS